MTTNRAVLEQAPDQWPLRRAMILAAICIAIGLCGGWLIRGWDSGANPPAAQANPGQPAPASAAQRKTQADEQVAPLLEQLKSQPGNADILTQIGNLYYDAQQYPQAVNYYGQVLQLRPADAAVRTDEGTAYWYMGNADSALAEFDKALSYQANNPNTLFNRGLVRWQGKHDAAGALADWKQLLATDADYEAKDKVQQMMAQVEGKKL